MESYLKEKITDIVDLLTRIKANQEKEQKSLLSIDKKLDTLVELVSSETDMASVLFDELINASDEDDYDEENEDEDDEDDFCSECGCDPDTCDKACYVDDDDEEEEEEDEESDNVADYKDSLKSFAETLFHIIKDI